MAGYFCFNDASARDWQFHTTQITPGKNFYGTGGFGPWMVTTDEIGDPQKLGISTRLNGEIEAGRLRNRGGDPVSKPIQEGLLREDGKILYIVDDDIPVMLIEESISLD